MYAEYKEVILDDDRIGAHPATSDEIKECLKDVKVLGRASLRALLQWRKIVKKDLGRVLEGEIVEDGDWNLHILYGPLSVFEKATSHRSAIAPEAASTSAVDENSESKSVDVPPVDEGLVDDDETQLIAAAKEDKRVEKKKKKKMLREKRREQKAIQLKMVIPGDRPDTGREADLFNLQLIKSKVGLQAAAAETPAPDLANDSDSSQSDIEMDDEKAGSDLEEIEKNPLLVTENSGMTKEHKMQHKADQWFSKETFAGLESDSDQDEILLQSDPEEENSAKPQNVDVPRTRKRKLVAAGDKDTKNGVAKKAKAVSSAKDVVDEDSESEPERSGTKNGAKMSKGADELEIVPQEDRKVKGKKRVKLDAETLAIGEKLLHSSKSRKEVIESAYNRYMSNDENLPDWFVADEKKHWRPELPVEKSVVAEYKQRERDLDSRPIKKVAEAKLRKKKRAVARLAKAKKKAEGIVDNPDMSAHEKARQMQTVYKKAVRGRKPELKYVKMTKAKRGTGSRPRGPYKMVDSRLKKDNRKKTTGDGKKAGKGAKGRSARNKAKGTQFKPKRASKTAGKGKKR